MADKTVRKFSVKLSFEEIRLPPFEDILIIGKKSPYGKMGITKAFQYLVPDEFETLVIDDKIVEAVFVNKKILKKFDQKQILKILNEKVFPYISACEILKVEFKLKIFYDSIEGEF